jgi:NAD(P)H-hydrate epimerase
MPFSVSTSAEVRALDTHTIEKVGVASLALMELAGRAMAAELLDRFETQIARGIVIFAGRGNNGGDGYVMARMLHARGLPVQVVGLRGDRSPDCAANRKAAVKAGVSIREDLPGVDWLQANAGVVVDALLGTGLSSALRTPVAEWVQTLNDAKLPVLAVDLPTGLCGDTGRVWGCAVRATTTVCIGRAKIGCYLEPGADFAGQVALANIGLMGDVPSAAEIVCGAWVAERLPRRSDASHKNQHGHLGVIAGSVECAGAAVLTCNAAVASGCGMVSLLIHPSALERLGQLGAEVMVLPTADPAKADLSAFSALAVGPGFGTQPDHQASLRTLWAHAVQPAVFDADALTALQGHFSSSAYARCLTPHPGEAARLLERNNGDIQADRLGAVRALAAVAPTLLKGRNTLIAQAGAAPVRINPTGNSALATAGSGDVLTGIVGAFLAQGVDGFQALTLGAFLHGWAAERLARSHFAAGELNGVLGQAMATVKDRAAVLPARSLFGP